MKTNPKAMRPSNLSGHYNSSLPDIRTASSGNLQSGVQSGVSDMAFGSAAVGIGIVGLVSIAAAPAVTAGVAVGALSAVGLIAGGIVKTTLGAIETTTNKPIASEPKATIDNMSNPIDLVLIGSLLVAGSSQKDANQFMEIVNLMKFGVSKDGITKLESLVKFLEQRINEILEKKESSGSVLGSRSDHVTPIGIKSDKSDPLQKNDTRHF